MTPATPYGVGGEGITLRENSRTPQDKLCTIPLTGGPWESRVRPEDGGARGLVQDRESVNGDGARGAEDGRVLCQAAASALGRGRVTPLG